MPGKPAGVTAVMRVAETRTTSVARTPPTLTTGVTGKFVPLRRIVVPPDEAPETGVTPVTVV
jgi:hypothetical protein